MDSPPNNQLLRNFDLIAASNNLAADTAFLVALPQLRGELQELALDKIVARSETTGLAAVVASFRKSDAHVRSLILERVGDLFEGARACMASDHIEERLSAIDLIQTSHETRLAYLLSNALTMRCPKTTAAAAAALLSSTRSILSRREHAHGVAQRRAVERDARYLADALEQALDSWPAHFRNEVLVASMWLCDLTDSALFKKLSSPKANIARGLCETLRQHPGPEMAPFALRALQYADSRQAATADIASNPEPAFHLRLIDEAWVTLDPAVAQGCRRIRKLGFLADGYRCIRDLTGRRARYAVRLIALSGMGGPDDKLNVFGFLFTNGSPEVAEAALWEVTRLREPGATALLQRAAASRHPDCSRIASLELFRRDPTRYPHDPRPSLVAAPSQSESAPVTPESYWDRFDVLDPEDRLRLGRRLHTMSPGFSPLIREKLSRGEPADRLRAMLIVRTLGISTEFQSEVYALSHDPNEKIRSLCVSLLAQIEGTVAVRILRRALNDPDPRVQANAIEVLGAIEATQHDDHMVHKLDTDNNRVRANAIRALLPRRVRPAAVALLDMLAGESPQERISALWVVERLGLVSAMPRVREMAAGDPDPVVQARARRILDEGGDATTEMDATTAEAHV